jgi:hypothetical protein
LPRLPHQLPHAQGRHKFRRVALAHLHQAQRRRLAVTGGVPWLIRGSRLKLSLTFSINFF